MKNGVNEITVISLEPIQRGGWTFKVSANDYEQGVLILATHDVFGYSSLRYFLDPAKGREWLNTLVSYTEEILREELRKLESANLQKK